MKKRLISMLMAVLMIASLLPAAALAGDDTADASISTPPLASRRTLRRKLPA